MAAVEVFANDPSGIVTSGGTDVPAAGTQETWTLAAYASFPVASSTASPPTQFHIADLAAPAELITVSNTSGATWTVTRGAEGTVPVAHAPPFTVVQVTTAGFLGGLAQLASPAFTGTPAAPTAPALTDSTQIATTAYVTTAVAAVTGAVASVTAGDTSIVVGGTGAAPTIETGTLDVIAADHPAAADWSNNSHKITSLANGSANSDAAAFGQIPSSSSPLALTAGGTGLSETTAPALLSALGAAPLASPALSGTPTAPTASALAASTQLATTAYADSAVAVETSRAEAAEVLKAPLASPALTGSPTAPTQTAGDSSTKIATDAFVATAVAAETTRAETAEALLAPLASPALTGTPTAPTASALTSTTQLATTAFTTAAVAAETTRAETAEALKLPLAGGTMSGIIAMGANKVTGLANGSAAQDAVAFGQLPSLNSTASNIQPDGSQLAGAVGSGADAGHVHPENVWWTASDQGYKACNFDVAYAGWSTFTSNPAAGTIYLARINIRAAVTISKIAAWWIAGTGTAASNTYLGLYTSAGAELGISSDFSASSTATVLAGVSIGSQNLTAGYYYAAFMIGTQFGTNKGGLTAAYSTGISGAGPNAGLSAAGFRWATNGTGASALPTGSSAFTLGSNAAIAYAFWCALL